jgi:GTP-binding protein
MMAKPRKLPLVAICGRSNVGKSTLFNRITGKQRAIIHPDEGITRDRSYAMAQYRDRAFRVVDTGGIVEHPIDPIVAKMQQQIRVALEEAHVIIFVVDGQQPITRTDEDLCAELFRLGKPVVLAVNKLDNPKLETNRFEFYRLGIGEPVAISSGHGLGMDALLDAVAALLPESGAVSREEELEERTVTKVAVVGKPNVGKSSFVNAILNQERTIVDERPGTTRDAIDIEFGWREKHYLLIDTAGMRKKAGIKREVERYSVARALRAIRRADVCLVLMDAVEGLTEQDKRILDYVQEQGAGMVLVWSKWDLVDDKERRLKALDDVIDLKAPFLRYVPHVTISNVTRLRLFKTFDYIDEVAAETEKRIPTAELNRLMEEIRGNQPPPSHRGKSAKILYATQASVKPTTFVLFVNQRALFHFSYLRFIENKIREKYGFTGVPIRVELREGKPRESS